MTKLRNLGGLLLALGCGVGKGDDASTSGATEPTASTTGTTATGGDSSTVIPTTAAETDASTSTGSTTESSTGMPPPPVPDPAFCPLDWAGETSISGTAPFGAFTGTRAWFEWQQCNGAQPLVLVVADPATIEATVHDEAPLSQAVAFMLPVMDWEHTAWTGEATPLVLTVVAGEWGDSNSTMGTVTVTTGASVADTANPGGTPRIAGEFALQSGDGEWNLSGTFDAAYCGPLNDILPMSCE